MAERRAYREAQEAIAYAMPYDGPRNPPNASGQLAIAKALLAVADAVHRAVDQQGGSGR